MRELTGNEVTAVSAGTLVCTGGTSGFNCTGNPGDWAEAFGNLYDGAVEWLSDLMCSASGKC